MVVRIVIDYREAALISALTALCSDNTVDLAIETKNLELGDVHIIGRRGSIGESGESGNNEFTLLFERKAGNDLAASIKDGRYAEQKARILGALPPHACTYILEGLTGAGTGGGMSQSTLDGAIIHTMYRDRMHVVHTEDVAETATFIKTVALKCVAHPQYFSAVNCNSDYVSTLKPKTKKKDNIDKATCYLLQLCQIPGISHTIAKEIAEAYPTYFGLVSAINACADAKAQVTLLKRIKMIADKKAKTIVEFIAA